MSEFDVIGLKVNAQIELENILNIYKETGKLDKLQAAAFIDALILAAVTKMKEEN